MTRRILGSLTASDLGKSITAPGGEYRGVITSVRHFQVREEDRTSVMVKVPTVGSREPDLREIYQRSITEVEVT